MNERKIGILISYINIVLHALVGFIYVPLLLHYIGKSEYSFSVPEDIVEKDVHFYQYI